MSFSSLFTGANVAAAPTSGFAGLFSTEPNAAAKTARLQQASAAADAATTQAKSDNSIAGIIKNTIMGLPNASGIPQAFSAGIQQANAGSKQANSAGGNIVQRAEGVLNFGAGVANAAFSPLAPVFSPIGKAINFAGEQLAKTPYMQAYGKDLASIPADQDNTPERILTAIQNISTIGQAVLGSGLIKGRLPEAEAGVGAELRTPGEVPVESPIGRATTETPVPAKSPFRELFKSEAPKVEVATERTAEPSAKLTETTPSAQPAPVSTGEASSFTSEGVPTVVEPLEANKVSGVAQNIDEAAVRQGLTEGLKDLAGFNSKTVADQSTKIATLINKDLNAFKGMVSGEVPIPKDISPEYLRTAAENYAWDKNDIELIKSLASSPLTSALSQHGSELGMARFRDEFSPVRAIQDVIKTRVAAAKRRGMETVKSISQRLHPELKKQTRQRVEAKTVAEFIKSIEC